MIQHATTPAARSLDEARQRILLHLAASPVPAAELPRRWPLTRHHVRLLVRDLALAGLVEIGRDGGRVPRVNLTAAGRLALARSTREP